MSVCLIHIKDEAHIISLDVTKSYIEQTDENDCHGKVMAREKRVNVFWREKGKKYEFAERERE